MNRKSQRGVALVITLMMLAIITIIVVVLLGLARRNRAGVSLKGSQTDAQYAAEYAFQRAKADVVSQILARKHMLGFDAAASHGLDEPPYTGYPMRDPVGNAAGPVLVNTNRNGSSGPLDSRYYLDLNRNREFERTLTDTNLVRIGDPQWIYIPDRLNLPYGQNNRFISRYAYVVVPAGKALDINAIHNINTNGSSLFLRNQGVGSFELNLAAYLHELDTNVWTYSYTPLAATPQSLGTAFIDATNIVHYRSTVPGVRRFGFSDLFGGKSTELSVNGIDDHGDDLPAGILFGLERPVDPQDDLSKPYAGAEALQHFFTPQDLFDVTKTSPAFVNNLNTVLRNTPGVTNGYKFYDMMAELATDTGNENRGRIDLNWANLAGYKVSSLTPWDSTNANLPIIFFTNAAQRILESMKADFFPWVTSVNRIMISPTNLYDQSVHRIMQQAANIFDAARTNEFPTVFRPIFGDIGTNTYIVAWTNDNSLSTIGNYLRDNTNGIPLVIGAKKGLPNFNEFTYRTDTLVTRKLQLTRPNTNSLPTGTNQMYIMGLSNSFAVESWNSYESRFRHPSVVQVSNTVTITVTNLLGGMALAPTTYSFVGNPTRTNIPAWDGRTVMPDKGFKITLMTNIVVLENSVYHFGNKRFEPLSTNLFESIPGDSFWLPYWQMTISNRLVYMHSVGDNIIDFVILSELVTNDLANVLQTAPSPPSLVGTTVWDTNRMFGALGPTEGIRAQIEVSRTTGTAQEWIDFMPVVGDRNRAVTNFLKFLLGSRDVPLVVETPFNPMARLTTMKTWQANDPLVHYHSGDLLAYGTNSFTKALRRTEEIRASDNPSSLTNYNKAYKPWASPGTVTSSAPGVNDPMVTDPNVASSDDWDFPYRKYASVGWLGKVHRGTPWQTVYLKAGATPRNTWRAHAGTLRNHPTNDYRLIDIFTTALTDNAARGLLSINQPRLAAWSAALSGVVVVTNKLGDDDVMNPSAMAAMTLDKRYDPIVIEPSGGNTNTPLWVIWNAIQRKRQSIGGIFSDFSELLAIPELTSQSPYLNYLNPNQVLFGIDDYAYERIPQQILGLLRVGEPRFVIYAYGQALKPETVNTSSGNIDNYQIMAEFATRTVMRVEGTAQEPKVVVETFNILPPD